MAGWIGYITFAVWGYPDASQRGTISIVVHKWVDWLHSPCRLGGPQHFRVEDEVGIGPHVSGLPATGPQSFRAGDKVGIGPHVSGLLSAGPPTLTKSEVAHKWAVVHFADTPRNVDMCRALPAW